MKTLMLCLIALSILLLPCGLWAQQQVYCPLSAILVTTSTGAIQVIAVPTTPTSRTIFLGSTPTSDTSTAPAIKICSVSIRVKQPGSAPADFGLVQGTGSNCATGQTNLTPQWYGTISVIDSYDKTFGGTGPLIAKKGNAVCLKDSAAPTSASVLINYAVQ